MALMAARPSGPAALARGQRDLTFAVEILAIDIEQIFGIAIENVDQRLVGSEIKRDVVFDRPGRLEHALCSHTRFNWSCHIRLRSSLSRRNTTDEPAASDALSGAENR